jgi:L-malate glycosyltransferase
VPARCKVAVISHSYVESAYRRKLVYLSESTDLQLITPSAYPTPYGWYELDFEFNRGVRIESYPIRFLHFRRSSTRWWLGTRDLGLSQLSPDIIHVENEQHSWITCQALLYRKRFAPRAKVLLFSWNNLEECGLKGRVLEGLAQHNRKSIDFFICGNVAGKDILVAKGIPAERVAVLPQSGVDVDVFYPYAHDIRERSRRKLGISQAEFTIGFVGRFVEEKGILDLIEAVGRLRQLSERKICLVLTGRGELEARADHRCRELSIRLILLAPRKYHETVEVMNLLDVLVLPSQSRWLWKEQFGRVLIEAMACGVPVIGSDSGEIPNVIGEAGLVFRECNREQLSECLRLVSENEALRSTLRERGLSRVLNKFTNERIAQETLAIYGRLWGADKLATRVAQNA